MSSVSLAKGRSNARKKAMQALYQWSMTGNDLSEIEVQFHAEQNMEKVDQDYFHELLHKVPELVTDLDNLMAPHLDRKLTELDPVEQAILRLSTYEMKHRLDVPYKVVLDESITLAKVFGADQSHKYVNGVLDKLAKQLRSVEVQSQ
ncbi:MAG: transcription antitermination factor NusB [Gammaproteobacteria bacterium]|nr:transcription antitermination factor NusB [Gammaproteobacteria bacterium]